MKNRYTKKIITMGFLFIGVILFSGCTDKFEEINAPKYMVGDEEMKGDNFELGAFFPQLINNAFPAQENSYQMNENLIGDVYGRYMMTTKSAWNATNFAVYNAPDAWIKHPFEDVMTKVYSAWNEIRKLTDGKGINFAWAQILRVAAMQRLTDMYGPIPYTKVVNGDLKVPYDSQKDVYVAMFDDLTEAINVLTTYVLVNPSSRSMAAFDGVYEGDFEKWIKFANSLKLRMAIRIRLADAVLAKEMAEEAVNHTFGVMMANSDNAFYSYVKGNPIFVMWSSYHDTRICADLTSYMNGYEDPRREKYFQKATIESTTGYLGIRSGGYSVSEEWACKYSSPNINKSDKLLWMPVAEVTFLRAEGALIGWNMKGSTEELYETAIKQSFEQWGAAGADTYIADNKRTQINYVDPNNKYSSNALSTITIKWDETASNEIKLEKIITQKWIAMYPIGQEAWSEYRRTGFPKLFPVPNQSLIVANRIPFSSDEYINNNENIHAAVGELNGNDNYETKLWWAKH